MPPGFAEAVREAERSFEQGDVERAAALAEILELAGPEHPRVLHLGALLAYEAGDVATDPAEFVAGEAIVQIRGDMVRPLRLP